jgi:hypothetical protein
MQSTGTSYSHPAVHSATYAFFRLAGIALTDKRTATVADRLSELLADHARELQEHEALRANPVIAAAIPQLAITPETLAAFTALEDWTRSLIITVMNPTPRQSALARSFINAARARATPSLAPSAI